MIKWFTWVALTKLTQIHVITIRNWTRYYIICIYFETYQSLYLTNIVIERKRVPHNEHPGLRAWSLSHNFHFVTSTISCGCPHSVDNRAKYTMFWRIGTSGWMRPSNLKLRSDKERIGKCSLEFLLHTQFTHSTIMGTIRVFCRHSVKTGNKSTMFRRTCTSQEMRPSNFKLTHDKESVGNVTWSPYWILNLQTPPSTSHTDLQVGLKTV